MSHCVSNDKRYRIWPCLDEVVVVATHAHAGKVYPEGLQSVVHVEAGREQSALNLPCLAKLDLKRLLRHAQGVHLQVLPQETGVVGVQAEVALYLWRHRHMTRLLDVHVSQDDRSPLHGKQHAERSH